MLFAIKESIFKSDDKMQALIKSVFILISILIFCFSGITKGVDDESKLNRIAEKAPERLLMDIKMISNGRLIAVGERGHIILSDDNGIKWRQVQVPTEVLLTKVYFVDGNIGWAIGHQQMILKTIDAGETWEVQNHSNNLEKPALFDIWFENANKGIAVGSYGLFLATDNGGENWEEVYLESLEDQEIGFPHFYSLAFEEKSKKLFMAAELGVLAVSDDFGENWEKIDSPYNGSLFHIAALPNGYLVAMGLRGHLFRSIDLGESWQEIETGTLSGLQNLLLLKNRNKLIILGSNGTQLVSEDHAKSVRLIQRSDRVHLAGAVQTISQDILLVGVNGVIKSEIN